MCNILRGAYKESVKRVKELKKQKNKNGEGAGAHFLIYMVR